MNVLIIVLFAFLILCAIAVSFSKKALNSIIIYMSYSLIMSVIWILIESPDLAITEAAVGAGVTSLLFFVSLKKIHSITEEKKNE
ncbi:MAG: hydrogenase subunit MbhD domain-containing protein [Eubacteriales bacterium]